MTNVQQSVIMSESTRKVREAALRHGFMGAGFARAEYMEEEARRLEAWLNAGHHGEMGYMANHFDLRVDPTRLVPGAKSVISLMLNYFPEEEVETCEEQSRTIPDRSATEILIARRDDRSGDLWRAGSNLTSDKTLTADNSPFKISRYAYGEDYHQVVRRKLKALVAELKVELGDFHARVFVDSAPVLERDWARRSGLGWVGKNTLLIHPRKGSYFFLAEIILDVEFEYDTPLRDHCGTCTRCIDACPTEAISPNGYVLDGSKCISYLTIELRSEIPEIFTDHMQGWIFGCDICQDVCPWNRFSAPHQEPAFEMSDRLRDMKRQDWLEITQEVFDGLFSTSAVKRTGYEGLKRNIKFLSPDRR